MLYSELLAAASIEAGVCRAEVPPEWTQGRSSFGGLQAALAVGAMRSLLPAPLPLRTLQTTFAAPVPPGPVLVRAQVLRSGKNTQQLEARLLQGQETLCLVIGIFGAARVSTIAVRPRQPEIAATTPLEFRHIPGLTPEFTQHFKARWLRGGLPFTGASEPAAMVEIGMRDRGNASEAHLLAIADFMPPLALAMLRQPAPGSSMTWMLELLRDRFDDLPLDGWRVDGEMPAARDGYVSQSLMVWAPGGEPAALSRQSMVVFA